jgi:hypothetical protein
MIALGWSDCVMGCPCAGVVIRWDLHGQGKLFSGLTMGLGGN